MDRNDERMIAKIREADSEDLLDRITVYRNGMESDAIELIEQELYRRGIKKGEVNAYLEKCSRECLFYSDGTAKECSLCRRPAVWEGWSWHRLMNKIPILPRKMRYCKEHAGPTEKR